MVRSLSQAVGVSLALVVASPAFCENDWTLLGGSAEFDQVGVPWNPTPGSQAYPMARALSATWVDARGNFWMYGGDGRNGVMSDLWLYATHDETWTFMGGQTTGTVQPTYPAAVGGIGNPGNRHSAQYWVDGGQNLWMFGGYGRGRTGASTWGFGLMNDLWKYDIAAETWYWMGGSQYRNDPGDYHTVGATGWPSARYYSVGTFDETTYYLYGGMNEASNRLQDFWSLEIGANPPVWTLLGGDATTNTVATLPASTGGTGYPGARYGQAMWIDNDSQVWLHGGYGYYAAVPGFLNDTWSYRPAGNQWTLQDVNNAGGYPAGHGGIGKPARRRNAAVWNTHEGVFLFGGVGTHPASGTARFNDLWLRNEKTGQWQWVDGTSSSSEPIPPYPVHGLTGSPLRRAEMNFWRSAEQDRLYFFGGTAGTSADYCHDFWVRDAVGSPSSVEDWQLWDGLNIH